MAERRGKKRATNANSAQPEYPTPGGQNADERDKTAAPPPRVDKPNRDATETGAAARVEPGIGQNDTEGHDDAISQRLGARVKELRAAAGWSLETLANASGVSRSMLSQIEREQVNPTLAVTMRIARAFALSLGELLEVPSASSLLTIIRADDRAYHYRSDKDCRIRTLSPLNLEKDVELYEVCLEPGGALRSAAHFQGTREFLTVEKGRVRVEAGNDAEELDKGDSATYRADVPHAIINLGRGEAVVFLVDIYR